MSTFVVEGGHRLCGDIIPQGAKNEALEILCATLLTEDVVTIHNLPDILDVNNLIALLKDMGVAVTRIGESSYTFQAKDINIAYLETPEFCKKMSI